MTTASYAGTDVPVNDEGFLVDPTRWTEAMGTDIAAEAGMPNLTDRHWRVIHFMRTEYEDLGTAPNVRALAKVSGVPVKELYQLFPQGPAKLAARIAGVPKPRGCI